MPKTNWKEGSKILKLGMKICSFCELNPKIYFEFSFCQRCRLNPYCGKRCLLRDWENHKKVCKNLILDIDANYALEID